MFWIIVAVLAAIPLYTVWQLWPPRIVAMGRNGWIGMRSEDTVRSDETWAAAHRAAWPAVVAASVGYVLVLVSGVAASLNGSGDRIETVLAIAGIAMTVYGIGLVWAFLLARRAARAVAPGTS